MPLYEYACPQCDHTFEELVGGDEKVQCPQCRSENVERLLSVPARPRVESLPTACNTEGPPCGAPWCRRSG